MGDDYGAHRWDGLQNYPTLYLDDVSEIPFLVNISGVEEYQHRARVRAGDDDLFAAVTPPVSGYEDYCRNRLGLGTPDLVQAEPSGNLLAVATACQEGRAFARIVERAREGSGLCIHPYMSIEPVWELARRVAASASVPVQVIGPPPPVTWIANDKLRFGALVVDVLGKGWIVRTESSRDPAELARHLQAIGRSYDRVGLKRTRCASAMGNRVFLSRDLDTIGKCERAVHDFLSSTEWRGDEDVLAVAWEETDRSPSTQTWIPPAGQGKPRVEGVYEQILEGPERVFVGSRPSRLGARLNQRLVEASRRVAAALQELGYVGRCSFDFLVVGEDRIRLTECNGRWGGTSIPMSLVNRLKGTPRPPYRAQDFVRAGLVGATFEEVLALADEGRYVFYNVGPLEASGKLDVIAFGPTQEQAEWALAEELPRRLGLS